jgi:urate oxidase
MPLTFHFVKRAGGIEGQCLVAVEQLFASVNAEATGSRHSIAFARGERR